jgi:hypothetical protein
VWCSSQQMLFLHSTGILLRMRTVWKQQQQQQQQ